MDQALRESPEPIRDFLIYMETVLGRSPKTVHEYFLDLRTFFRYLLMSRGLAADLPFDEIPIDQVDLALIDSVTRSEILSFLLFLSRERPKYHTSPETTFGNTAKTRARKTSSLRKFYHYLCEKNNQISHNPTRELDTPKPQKTLPKFLSLQESLDLLSAVDGRYQERDYCILVLFLNCGLRVAELVGANLSDISDDRLRVLGKGSKERIIYLNEACRDAIASYLPVRIQPKEGHRNALFISRLGRRIDEQTVKWLVKKYLSGAGLAQKHCSAHKLRHTAATLMYQNGVDVRTLKEVLGHENLDTTMIYTHVVDQNLKQAADQNPLANVHKKSGDK